MQAFNRLLTFIWFTLLEYGRSGRILVEFFAGTVFFYIFFVKHWTGRVDGEAFFTLTGIFLLALAIYTVSSMIHLGDRPHGYVILSRKIGRAGYLCGYYIAAYIIIVLLYLLISLAGWSFHYVKALDTIGWLIGSVPLLLNIGLFMALLLMLSPMVFSTGWRLFILGLIALAFSGNFLSGPAMQKLPETARILLASLQMILSLPLVPAFSGFALSVHHKFGSQAVVVIVAQLSLLVALLSMSLYAFSQRELVFDHD